MRTLTELEMSVAAGGVDPIPSPFEPSDPCMTRPDPIWTSMILELMSPPRVNVPDR